MKLWKICGVNLPVLLIYAESFDDALQSARTVNKNYCVGQVTDE